MLFAICFASVFIIFWVLWKYHLSPLKSFPGPFVARFTNLWRFWDVYKGQCHKTLQDLHRKHGSAVCVGPDIVSLSDPKLIKIVYNTKGTWKKSSMYNPSDIYKNGEHKKNVFSEQNEEIHSMIVRPINCIYRMPYIQETEPAINKTIDLFLGILQKRYAGHDQPCPMAEYINYFSWDSMSEITFSENMGLLEAGSDYKGVIKASQKSIDYFSLASQVPFLDFLFDKNGIVHYIRHYFGKFFMNLDPPGKWAREFGLEPYRKRMDSQNAQNPNRDFLDKYIEVVEKSKAKETGSSEPSSKDPTKSTIQASIREAKKGQESANMPESLTRPKNKETKGEKDCQNTADEDTITMYLVNNLVAGSDTTASTMCSAIYHILKNPEVHKKLLAELDNAKLPTSATWRDIISLKYLDAVMREAMRINPGVGLLLERIVPKGGLMLADRRFLPEGMVVGMNAWVINRDKTIFGDDADSFNPDRWLQKDEEPIEDYKARVNTMKNTDFTFGAGRRICLGRHLSQLESYKLISALFSNFHLELTDINHEWTMKNLWFVRQENIPVLIKKRES